VRCPACRAINSIDLRALDRHRDAAISRLIPSLSCRLCRPNAPFAELVCEPASADEMREEVLTTVSRRMKPARGDCSGGQAESVTGEIG